MNSFRRLVPALAGMAVALTALLLSGANPAHAQFNPTATLNVVDTSPGANSNIDTEFGVDAPDYNFGAVIGFTPDAWGVASDADIPDGTKVGELNADATLGLVNNPCKNKVFPIFELVDGTTDSSNFIDPEPPGTPDRLAPLTEDSNGNGVIDGAEQFPSFLGPPKASNPDALFDSEALGDLRARLFGATTVSGIKVTLNFMIFEPGAKIDEDTAIDPALGYPSVTVLNDPTAPASNEDAITDFCSPLESRTTLQGTAGGQPFRTNPSEDGTYNFMTFVASLIDSDGDGIENPLDPCPLDKDDEYGGSIGFWDPRTQPDGPAADEKQDPGDIDGDGIPDSCDPNPTEPSAGTSGIGIAQTDEDEDGWANRNDNCTIVSNEDQEDTDGDGIGDDCDPNPDEDDGDPIVLCVVNSVTIGAGGEAPPEPNLCTTSQIGIDLDGNGVFDSQETDAVGDDDDTTDDTTTTTDDTTTTDTTTTDGDSGSIGGVGGPDTGIGSLAPAAASIPGWAAALSALGGAGLLGGLGSFAARIFRRRD